MSPAPEPAPWGRLADEAPELAGAVQARLTATKHHVLATLRQDGSPRVSGTEVQLRGPELTIGSMPNAPFSTTRMHNQY